MKAVKRNYVFLLKHFFTANEKKDRLEKKCLLHKGNLFKTLIEIKKSTIISFFFQ